MFYYTVSGDQILTDVSHNFGAHYSCLLYAIYCDFPDHTVSASEGEDEEENEFYDALGGEGGNSSGSGPILPEGGSFTLNIPTGGYRRNSSDSSDETDEARETQKVFHTHFICNSIQSVLKADESI